MRVIVDGKDTVDTTEYLKYTGNDKIDIEIAKHNIGRFIYKYMNKVSSNILPNTSLLLECIDNELYERALLLNMKDGVDYIKILANRISTLLSLHGDSRYSMKLLIDFLEDQIR